jgi:uncharacterized protein (TIGR00251 family)
VFVETSKDIRTTMSAEQLPFTIREKRIILKVKAFPKAGRNQIVGVRNGELVVRVQAPASKGEANKELVRYLAKALSISKSEIEIVSGAASRHKVIDLPRTAESALEKAL